MLKERLKTIRLEKKMTQKELAGKLYVVRQTVSKWEKGLSVPDASMLVEIANVLEVSVDDLLGKSPLNTQQQLSLMDEKAQIQARRLKKMKTLGMACLIFFGLFCLFEFFLGPVTWLFDLWKDESLVSMKAGIAFIATILIMTAYDINKKLKAILMEIRKIDGK